MGTLALFHGHSHGSEMPLASSPALYALGFVLATALLHAVGAGAGLLARQADVTRLLRAAGVALAATGALFLLRLAAAQ